MSESDWFLFLKYKFHYQRCLIHDEIIMLLAYCFLATVFLTAKEATALYQTNILFIEP